MLGGYRSEGVGLEDTIMSKKSLVASLVLTLGAFGCSSHHSSSPQATTASNLDIPANYKGMVTEARIPALTAATFYAAGQVAESQGRLDVAISQYKESLNRDSKYKPSVFRLAVVYTELKQYATAIDLWNRYIELTDNNASAYSDLALCQELEGQPRAADLTYQKALAIDPKNVAVRTNYGLMLARHGHPQEAIRMWQPVLSDAEIHFNLASVYELHNRKLEAKAEYEKALAADPNFRDAKDRLAGLDE